MASDQHAEITGAGVVNEDIEPAGEAAAERLIDLRNERGRSVMTGQIGADGFGFSAGGFDFRDDPVRAVAAGGVVDEDGRAFAGEALRDGGADTARGAGDEGEFTLE